MPPTRSARPVDASATAAPHPHVVPLPEIDATDLPRAGGKGANLGALIRAGHRVPDGFVVTTDAYAAVVADSGLDARIAALLRDDQPDGNASDPDGPAGAAIRAKFATVDLPAALRDAIVAAHTALGGGPVAVRSSATAEDLPGAAFAGQQDTYLNVVGAEAVLDAVRDCWGSLWTDRAIAYRRRRGIDSGEVRIAVVVQAMVEAETAGVMFTANPVTGARDEIVVDASSGLGEAVVSGRVTPDHYVLDSRGRVRAWTPGRREVVIRGVADGGTREETATATTEAGGATEAAGEARQLADRVLTELAGLGRAVAEQFGRPQDMEWAYADDQVWLLQARPLTALPPPPQRLTPVQRRTGPVIIELFPYRPYPLDMTAWILPGPGRLVTRMMEGIPGLRVNFPDVLPEVDGVVDRFVPPHPRPTPGTLTTPIRLWPKVRRHDPARWTDDPRFARFERRLRALADHDPRDLTWAELVAVPDEVCDVLDEVTELRVDYLPGAGLSLLRLLLLLTVLRRRRLFASLIMGGRTRTQDTNNALAAIAELVRADPERAAAFTAAVTTAELAALAERVRTDPAFADVRAALDAFVAEYGHRETASALLVSAPTLGESPAALLGAVQALVDGHTAPSPPALEPAGSASPTPATPDRATQALRALLEHPLVRWTRAREQVRRAVRAARDGIAMREDTHFHFSRLLPLLRRALLETGRRLVDAGALDTPEDVFHLRLAELAALPEPATAPDTVAERVRPLVRERAARRAELAGVPLVSPATLYPDRGDDSDALLTGTPGGSGRATGTVRVIREPAEFGRLRAGEVLVCPYTNPSWTPLFQRAAAVVVDAGGAGSHAAIVAREYGIPAVMATGSGTSTLVDGQRVTVDGDHGRVVAADDGEGD